MQVENLSYGAANEAYTLITAYIREEKIAADYDKEELTEFAQFLAAILKHPGNFVTHLEGDALMSCLFARQDMRLLNIKFCRGSADTIDASDFRAEVHSAIMQSRMNPNKGSTHAPRSGLPRINVKEFVANLS